MDGMGRCEGRREDRLIFVSEEFAQMITRHARSHICQIPKLEYSIADLERYVA